LISEDIRGESIDQLIDNLSESVVSFYIEFYITTSIYIYSTRIYTSTIF